MSRRKSKFAAQEALSLEELMPDRKELAALSGGTGTTPETAYLRRENARRLRDAVQKLAPEYRLVLVLHDMEDLSDGDIAEITGLRPGTIRVRLHRARLFVRKEIATQSSRRAPGAAQNSFGRQHRPGQQRCKEMFAELSNYLDDQLDESLCEELEKHMEGCDPCQAFLANLESSIQLCRMAPNESPDPRVAAELRRNLLADYRTLMREIRRGKAGPVRR